MTEGMHLFDTYQILGMNFVLIANLQNSVHADLSHLQESNRSIWSVPGRLLVFLLALAATTFLTGTLLRFNMHHIQQANGRESQEPGIEQC